MKIFSALSLLLGMLTVMAVSSGSAEAAKYRVLHTFRSANDDGYYPVGTLYRDAAGNIYGTTRAGGVGEPHTQCIRKSMHCRGTVFKITKDGVETVLHTFQGSANGSWPLSGLVGDRAGNLYGTTKYGDGGTLFKITLEGDFTVQHNFKGDVISAPSSLLLGNNGNLYGLPTYGPSVGGSVAELSTAGQVLFTHGFGTGTDGDLPDGNLAQDHAGNVYGTTQYGGPCAHAESGGTIFKIDIHNVETSYAFGCIEGNNPAGLVLDGSHNMYGISFSKGCPSDHESFCGSVFEVSAGGSYAVLHNFDGGKYDGAIPTGPLAIGKDGNLYGFTRFGGVYGNGTIYRMTMSGAVTILHYFAQLAGPDNLMMDNKGRIYGTSEKGGEDHKGFVFMLDPNVP